MVSNPIVYIPTCITGIHKLYMNLTQPRSNSALTELLCKALPDFTVSRAMLLCRFKHKSLSIKPQRRLFSFHDLFEISI